MILTWAHPIIFPLMRVVRCLRMTLCSFFYSLIGVIYAQIQKPSKEETIFVDNDLYDGIWHNQHSCELHCPSTLQDKKDWCTIVELYNQFQWAISIGIFPINNLILLILAQYIYIYFNRIKHSASNCNKFIFVLILFELLVIPVNGPPKLQACESGRS